MRAMAEPKTRPTKASVAKFIDSVADEDRRRDCKTIMKMMKAATGESPVMWGESIVGFGSAHLKYASGRELDWPRVAFSPRKSDLTLYVLSGGPGEAALLGKLGKHKTGKSCLYLKRLADVDLPTLEKLVRAAVKR